MAENPIDLQPSLAGALTPNLQIGPGGDVYAAWWEGKAVALPDVNSSASSGTGSLPPIAAGDTMILAFYVGGLWAVQIQGQAIAQNTVSGQVFAGAHRFG